MNAANNYWLGIPLIWLIRWLFYQNKKNKAEHLAGVVAVMREFNLDPNDERSVAWAQRTYYERMVAK